VGNFHFFPFYSSEEFVFLIFQVIINKPFIVYDRNEKRTKSKLLEYVFVKVDSVMNLGSPYFSFHS
jgi:hypothetical protein